MDKSYLADTYNGLSIHTISPGSIVVNLYLYYNLSTNATAIDLYNVMMENEETFLQYGIELSADNLTVQGRHTYLW